jgi:hypothetical protein
MMDVFALNLSILVSGFVVASRNVASSDFNLPTDRSLYCHGFRAVDYCILQNDELSPGELACCDQFRLRQPMSTGRRKNVK